MKVTAAPQGYQGFSQLWFLYCFSVTSDSMCNQWKGNCVQTYSEICSLMNLRVFSSNNTKSFMLLLILGSRSVAAFTAVLFKDYYLLIC